MVRGERRKLTNRSQRGSISSIWKIAARLRVCENASHVTAQSQRIRNVGRLQVIATAVLFSTGGAAIKATSLDGLATASLRSAFAASAIAVFLLMERWSRCRNDVPPRRARTDRFDALALGVALSYAATMTLFVVATKLTTAANAIFIQASAPLFVAPLAYLALGERVVREDLYLMAALSAGVALFFAGAREPLATAPSPLLGNFAAMASALVWALTIVGLRRMESLGRDAGRLTLLPGNLLVAAGAGALARWGEPIARADWAIVAYLGVAQIALAYLLLTRGLRKLPAVEASLLLLLEPVLSALWAWLVHGEAPSTLAKLGGLLVLSAVMARSRRRVVA